MRSAAVDRWLTSAARRRGNLLQKRPSDCVRGDEPDQVCAQVSWLRLRAAAELHALLAQLADGDGAFIPLLVLLPLHLAANVAIQLALGDCISVSRIGFHLVEAECVPVHVESARHVRWNGKLRLRLSLRGRLSDW